MSLSPSPSKIALGLDLGSQSARAGLFCAVTGAILGQGVAEYEGGQDGVFLDPSDPNVARQRPSDYLSAIEKAVSGALSSANVSGSAVIGIGIGTTGSTPIPVDTTLRPLADNPNYETRLDAMAWMWKDHTAFAEAEEIETLCREKDLPYLSLSGGSYSSEWYWAKALRCARHAPDIFDEAHLWLELQDFIPAVLSGASSSDDLKLGVCAAGHKGMYSRTWFGFPSAEFFAELDPRLASLRARLPNLAYASNHVAGKLSQEWASRLMLPEGTPIAVGCLDAHAGAIGSGVAPGTIVKIMGTSTCDMAVSDDAEASINPAGLCGVVDGSIIPEMTGLEAGQSAVGDLLEWGARLFASDEQALSMSFETLSEQAACLNPGESGLLALDWNNGNRSVLMDTRLSGLLLGQSLQTKPYEIYRALIEATAFGGRIILDQFEHAGAPTDKVVICGGVASKSALVRQVYADIFNREIELETSEHTCARGAAMIGAVVGGAHSDLKSAQSQMSAQSRTSTHPIAENVAVYAQLFELYCQLQNGFRRDAANSDLSAVMKTLLTIRDQARNQTE